MMSAMMRVLALVLSAVSWPSLVCRALGGGAPRPLPQLAALAPAATVPAILAVPVAASRSRRLALALAVPAALLAWWQLPPRPPGRDRLSADGSAGQDAQPDIRVLTLNMYGGRAEAKLLVSVLASSDVDVLMAQEVTPDLVARLELAGLPDLLPYGVVDARPGHAGAAIWSRWPLTAAKPVPGMALTAPRAVMSLHGRQVTMTAVHVMAPMRGRDYRWQLELRLLGSRPTGAGGPELLAGDFNATRDHRPFRQILAAGYLDTADSAVRREWPAFTWPSGRQHPPGRRRLPIMRLDHVLVTREHFAVRESRAISVPGSDHIGVLATVRLVSPGRRPAADGQATGRV